MTGSADVAGRFTTGAGHGFRANGRISPYFEGVETAGGRDYTKEFNTYVAWTCDLDRAEQYRALTERVVLWDTASLRQIQVTGVDAITLADYVLTRDIRRLTPGRCAYAFVCDARGVIICDPVVLVIDENTVWFSVAGTDLELWLRGIAIGRDLKVEISEVRCAPLQVQGPASPNLMNRVCDRPIDDLGFFRHGRRRVAGVEAVVSRTGWTGERGYEIYPLDSAFYPSGREPGMRLWDALLAAGRDLGIAVTPYVTDRALEGGIMVFNHANREEVVALEFHRRSAVELDGADFIGKAGLVRLLERGGPTRRLLAAVAQRDGERIENGEWDLPVYKGDTLVGTSRRQASPTASIAASRRR